MHGMWVPWSGTKILHASWPNIQSKKKKKKDAVVTNSVKTLKMAHIKNKP